MNIRTTKVKQYNSTKKIVLLVDNVPVSITRTEDEASKLISYLNGYNVELEDSSIKRVLDDVLKNGVTESKSYHLKSYKGKFFTVIMGKKEPVLLVSSTLRANAILRFLEGENIRISDGKALKALTRVRYSS